MFTTRCTKEINFAGIGESELQDDQRHESMSAKRSFRSTGPIKSRRELWLKFKQHLRFSAGEFNLMKQGMCLSRLFGLKF